MLTAVAFLIQFLNDYVLHGVHDLLPQIGINEAIESPCRLLDGSLVVPELKHPFVFLLRCTRVRELPVKCFGHGFLQISESIEAAGSRLYRVNN
jgi:hypothetical protein